MPILFIHGVNVRHNKEYLRDQEARDELIRRLLLQPLKTRGVNLHPEVISPYWGKHGVSFRWNQVSVPDVRTLEALGSATATPQSDIEFTSVVQKLADRPPADAGELESLGIQSDSKLKEAALNDLPQFVEAVLTPIIFSEMSLSVPGSDSSKEVGFREALLIVAGQQIANNPATQARVATARTDEELLQRLREDLQKQFRSLLISSKSDESSVEPSVESAGDRQENRLEEQDELEPLGFNDWFSRLQQRVKEVFDRSKDAPMRVASVAALDQFRETLHANLTQFLGDVFVYLDQRGSKTEPGKIVSTVLDALKAAHQRHSDEPLIIITHSMGGNILYDILTFYAPEIPELKDLKVDLWISVGGQVGQFEEMKLFKASNEAIAAPDKVTGLKPERVGYWVNIYDPADVLSFQVASIFADADADLEYRTGASAFKSHGAYFKRASFYELIKQHAEKALI